jgi:hypothetical protein
MASSDSDWLELEDEQERLHRYLISELVEVEDKTYLALIPERSVDLELPAVVLVRYYLEEEAVEELVDAKEYNLVFKQLQQKYGEKAVLN